MTDTEILNKLRYVVKEQAEDDGLWFHAQYGTEAYLQQELRRIHAIIEDNDRDLALIEGRIK